MPIIFERTPEMEKAFSYGYKELVKDIFSKVNRSRTEASQRLLEGRPTNEDLMEMLFAGVGGGIKKLPFLKKLGIPEKHISQVVNTIKTKGSKNYSVTILENQFGVRIGRKDGQEVLRVRGPGLPREGVMAVENQLAEYGLKKPWIGKYSPQIRRRVEERVDEEFVKVTKELLPGTTEILRFEERQLHKLPLKLVKKPKWQPRK